MQYSTIFFDLDDTLWDTAANSRESLEEIYHQYSFDRYYDTFDDFFNVYCPFNLSLWDLYEQHSITKQELMGQRFLTPFLHVEGIDARKAMEINFEFMERTSSKSRTIKGAKEILELLKPYYRMCVLSNGFQEVQSKKLHNGQLASYFDEVVLSDDIGKNKPDPALFSYALSKMNVTAQESVMIGDNWKSDIIGAEKSGIDQVWYNPDNDSEKDFMPTYTIRQLSDLENILLK